jgi:phosphatidylglycerol:prolipoprotein diacylglycerol transferase
MIQYPHIDPIALSMGPIKIHWYGIMYLIGFFCAWALLYIRRNRTTPPWTNEDISDLIFYGALGVLLGGRIGYMLFYNFHTLLTHPWAIGAIWQGGMSFHGGMIGVILAMLVLSKIKKGKHHFFDITDFIAPVVPIGLAAGRIGNFINGELWGRVTHVPWGMVFPHAGDLPRHPSQLYEFSLEGVLLFCILWGYSSKRRPRMAVSGLFLIGYGIFRTFSEFFRQPDSPLGYIAFGWLTMGELLSLPMILLGLGLLFKAYKRGRPYETIS